MILKLDIKHDKIVNIKECMFLDMCRRSVVVQKLWGIDDSVESTIFVDIIGFVLRCRLEIRFFEDFYQMTNPLYMRVEWVYSLPIRN